MRSFYKNAGFIGLGLIGGSIAKVIRKTYPETFITVYDVDKDALTKALDEGIAKTTQTESSIKAAKAAGADIVAVAFHWGSELATEPDETQKALAHLAIDCGADLVVGHHPHVLQGIEIYKDKYIVYSLGNFCFGGNTHPTDMDTMIFQQTFTVSQDRTVSPGAINIVPCSVSSTADFNDYRPTRATGSEATRILDKVRTLSNGLGTSLQITM